MRFFKALWRGEKPLWFTFWVITNGGLTFLESIPRLLNVFSDQIIEFTIPHMMFPTICLISILYLLFCIFAVWRCSSRYISEVKMSEEKTHRVIWGYLSKAWVLIAIFYLYLLMVKLMNDFPINI